MFPSNYKQFLVKWVDGGRPPSAKPDPKHPDGVDLVLPASAQDSLEICSTKIPYPTGHENIGTWLVTCRRCGFQITVTAASRPDDPKSITFPCQKLRMKKGMLQ